MNINGEETFFMPTNHLVWLLQPVVNGLGLDSTALTPAEDDEMRKLAKEVNRIYQGVVQRYKSRLR